MKLSKSKIKNNNTKHYKKKVTSALDTTPKTSGLGPKTPLVTYPDGLNFEVPVSLTSVYVEN